VGALASWNRKSQLRPVMSKAYVETRRVGTAVFF